MGLAPPPLLDNVKKNCTRGMGGHPLPCYVFYIFKEISEIQISWSPLVPPSFFHWLGDVEDRHIHSKSEKVCGTAFSEKKLRKKCVNPGVIFGPFGGNFGPFWVIFGPFWVILGHSRAIMGHFGSYLGHFGSYLVHFGPLWAIFGPLVAYLEKIAESSNFFAG